MENDRWDGSRSGDEDSGDDEDFGFEEVPAEAREMIQRTERVIAEIEGQLQHDIDELNERVQKEIAALQKRAGQKLRVQRLQLLDQLKPMMEAYAGKGKLDEALGLRDHIRKLRSDNLGVRKDPGNLLNYSQHVGKNFVFDVTGSANGALWGTEVYTADSHLATAAVHAGVLRAGERGYVRVSLVDMTGMVIEGCERNGVLSHPWGPYPFGYRVSRA